MDDKWIKGDGYVLLYYLRTNILWWICIHVPFIFQVYYVPAQVFYNGSILPTIVTLVPILREIFIRERIQIVHGHGAFSSLSHDSLFIAKMMNLKVSEESNKNLFLNP